MGSKRTLQSYDCYYPPKGDDIEYNFSKWCVQKENQEQKLGKGIQINVFYSIQKHL